jgi:YesN/AraC family two-component response regulator
LRIAIADDESEMLRYYARFIPRLGHEVVWLAEDGQKLLEDCQLNIPDLVITDLSMPRLDGLAVMRQIDTPFVIVSAHPEPECPDPILKGRCIAWLIKPIKQTDLKHVLAAAVDWLEQRPAAASDSERTSDSPASIETDDDSAHDG